MLCFADDHSVESVGEAIKQLFELGLVEEYFKNGLKLVIEIAPVDNPHLMHDSGALFDAFRSGELNSTLGGVILENAEDGIRKGDAANHAGAVEEPLFAEDVGRSLHILENVQALAPLGRW